MATATLPLLWKGQSGRTYVPVRGARVRHGHIGAVRKVHAVGAPAAPADPAADVPLALKVWTEGGEGSLDQLQREIQTLRFANGAPGDPIAPRVFDRVGDPVVVGVITEWCPANLEDWWHRTLREADAFGRLMAALAEVCRQAAAWHRFAAGRGGLDVAHGDLKPTNILLSGTGAWLLSDFGVPPVDPPEDSPWAESDVVPGGGAFLSPELRFHALVDRPAAIDVWSLGAIAFAMLRMRRFVIDGAPTPRNGAESLRFASRRSEQIVEIYRDSPTRFFDKPLDPTAFPSPERMPDPDRIAVREALRGAFGDEDEEAEAELADAVLAVLDRALAISPARRYPDADTLAGAFESLARRWIGIAAGREEDVSDQATTPSPAIDALIMERDISRARAAALSAEVTSLQERLDALSAALAAAREQAPAGEGHASVAAPGGPDRTLHVLVGIGVLTVLQIATLVGVVFAIALLALLVAG